MRGKIQAHLGEVVRSTVEETSNAMRDIEADRLCRAERYERTEARKDIRAGSYRRQLHTKVGEVTLKVPKLRTPPFETAIIERCRRVHQCCEFVRSGLFCTTVSGNGLPSGQLIHAHRLLRRTSSLLR